MNRLGFALEDWTRLIWHSAEARRVWEGRINNINEAWSRIERWAVVDGARDSCLTFFEPQHLPELTMWAASHGLTVLPLAQVGVSDQYSATPKSLTAGQRWQYRVVITRPPLVQTWLDAWRDTGEGGRYKGTNNRVIGELLGYPPCCIDFFERVWVQAHHLDTTWPMTENTPGLVRDEGALVVPDNLPYEANILLRWLGVRLVSHLPCSFGCAATIRLARDYVEVGRQRQFGEWVDRIVEMLQWPVEWNALHGTAEIRTPILTISSRTDATAKKAVVQKRGALYPEEGAQGLRFPYRIVKGKATGSPSFARSVTPVWTLNGFGSAAAMEQAHAVVLKTLLGAPKIGSLLDLGCGTGRLLELAQVQGWRVAGVENDPVRAGASSVPVRRGDLFDLATWSGEWDVAMMMPGRLLEQDNRIRAEYLINVLKARADCVLLYAYGDWLTRYDGLIALAVAAGLGVHDGGNIVRGSGVEAMLISTANIPGQFVAAS